MLVGLLAAIMALGSPTVVAQRKGVFVGCSVWEAIPIDGYISDIGRHLDWCLTEACGRTVNGGDVLGPYISFMPSIGDGSDDVCICSSTGVTKIDPTQGDANKDPWETVRLAPQGQCDTDWEESGVIPVPSYLMTDKWEFNSCASTITPVGASITTTQPQVNECWASCEGYNYATIRYDTKECMCADYFTYVATGCSGSSNYIWPKRGMPSASQLAKRRARALEIAARRGADTPCPGGLQACVVPSGGLECLDTTSELESCGGCVYASANATMGTDCTALSGVHPHYVACRNSECVVRKCRPGWTLVNGACMA